MRITLVVPGLLSLSPATLARDAALSRLAALASVAEEIDVDSALLADVGIDAASAPLAALGAGVDVDDRWTVRADPVSMVVGREDARVHDIVDDLDDAERATLVALLNAHFVSDGLVFAAPRADAWFAMMATAQAVRLIGVQRSLGADLRPLLPSGEDAARWRRWLTEAQMLLHEHPLADRARPVNAIWFSDGGTLAARDRVPRLRAYAARGRSGDVVRGLARRRGEDAGEPVQTAQMLASRDCDAIVALGRVSSDDAWAALSRGHVAPALDALDRSQVSSVKLIADGAGRAASWLAKPASWLQRLRRRTATFAPPAHR